MQTYARYQPTSDEERAQTLQYKGGHQYIIDVYDAHGDYLDGARAENWRALVEWARERYPDARPVALVAVPVTLACVVVARALPTLNAVLLGIRG
jgi:hypothetical protein